MINAVETKTWGPIEDDWRGYCGGMAILECLIWEGTYSDGENKRRPVGWTGKKFAKGHARSFGDFAEFFTLQAMGKPFNQHVME